MCELTEEELGVIRTLVKERQDKEKRDAKDGDRKTWDWIFAVAFCILLYTSIFHPVILKTWLRCFMQGLKVCFDSCVSVFNEVALMMYPGALVDNIIYWIKVQVSILIDL